MNKINQKRLTANEVYLSECMDVLAFKISAIGCYIHDENGETLPKQMISVEGDEHETITIIDEKSKNYNTDRKRVIFDGTNYQIEFISSDDGGFVVRNSELGIEYVCAEKKLDEMISMNKVYRISGTTTEYYKFLSCDGMCIPLEYKGKDDDVKTEIINNYVVSMNEQEIISYAVDEFAKISEDWKVDKEEIFLEADEDIEDKAKERDEEEISAYVDSEYKDYSEINYISKAVPNVNQESEEIVNCNLPDNVHLFDYTEYINSDGKIHTCRREEPCDSIEEEYYEDYEDWVEEDEQLDEERKELREKLKGIAEQCISTDSSTFVNPEHYSVFIDSEEIVEEELIDEILDDIATQTMDVCLEIEDYKDDYAEITREFDKIKEIIIRRKNKEDIQEEQQGVNVDAPDDFEL